MLQRTTGSNNLFFDQKLDSRDHKAIKCALSFHFEMLFLSRLFLTSVFLSPFVARHVMILLQYRLHSALIQLNNPYTMGRRKLLKWLLSLLIVGFAAGGGELPSSSTIATTPLLLRVARGEVTCKTPVWMMRQAGRHMAAYRELIHQYPTFRDRSETPEISLQISLQPFEAYSVDGCIIFSDILTPLPAMGIDFEISESGKIIIDPIRTQHDRKNRLKRVSDYGESCHFVRRVLECLRDRVPTNGGTVLGFVGLPFTIGSYLIEGETGVAKGFAQTKEMIQKDPELVHDIFSCLADNMGDYACFQIEAGAQVIQVFDSWAGHVCDEDYETFCIPYQKQVVAKIKERFPDVPVIIYMAPGPFSQHGRRLQHMAATGVDVVSVDHTIDMEDACKILPRHVGIQGNLDPQLLRDGPKDVIEAATLHILGAAEASGRPHIMNLGHGILSDTPEEHAAFFVDTVHKHRRSMREECGDASVK